MDQPPLLLRAASEADGPLLEALAREADLNFLAQRDLARSDGLAIVAAIGSTVVGFIAGQIIVDEAEVLDLVTAFRFRRRGVARRLLADLVEQAQARGVTRVLLEVRRSNLAAIALYESAGFVQVGERLRYYRDGEDALLFTSSLATPAP